MFTYVRVQVSSESLLSDSPCTRLIVYALQVRGAGVGLRKSQVRMPDRLAIG